MTKQTRKQLIEEFVGKSRAVRDKSKTLLHEVIREGRREYLEIQKNPRLSPEGKALEKEDTRKHINEQFLKHSAELKAEYKRYISMAKDLAREVVAAPPTNNMTEAQNAAFEASVSDLKARVLLHPHPAKAAQLVSDFVRSNKDEYKSFVIAQQFHSIVAPVISTLGAEQKATLLQTYEAAHKGSISEEKAYAQQVLEMQDEPRFYQTAHDNPYFMELRAIIGRRGAEQANEPEKELARLQSGVTVEDEMFGREPAQTVEETETEQLTEE